MRGLRGLRGPPGRPGRSDGGQASFATLGFVIVLIGLVGLVTDVGGAVLVQQRLQGDADTAALAATTAIDGSWVAGGSGPPLDEDAANRQAGEALRRRGFSGSVDSISVDGTSVSVAVSRDFRPALLGVLGMGSTRLTARATAHVRSG